MMRAPCTIMLLLAMGCRLPIDGGREDRTLLNVSIAPQFQAASVVTQPYVSVVDSIALIVTPDGERPIVFGKHLTRRESAVSFPVNVPDGRVRFEVRILSVAGTVLFDGLQTVDIDSDRFDVEIPLIARRPVMVIAPDTLRVTVPTTADSDTLVVVHNRGSQQLDYIIRVGGISPDLCGACLRWGADTAGRVPPYDSVRVRVITARPFPTPIPIQVQSADGDVVLVIRMR